MVRLRGIGGSCDQEEERVDHSKTMRSAYERINAGDIGGFGELVADDFVEHEETPGLPPTKAGTLEFFRALLRRSPTCTCTSTT